MSTSGKSTTLATTFFSFLHFCQSSVANMAANCICIKQKTKILWKEEMSYGGDTWYMGRIYEELKLRLRLANFHLHN